MTKCPFLKKVLFYIFVVQISVSNKKNIRIQNLVHSYLHLEATKEKIYEYINFTSLFVLVNENVSYCGRIGFYSDLLLFTRLKISQAPGAALAVLNVNLQSNFILLALLPKFKYCSVPLFVSIRIPTP